MCAVCFMFKGFDKEKVMQADLPVVRTLFEIHHSMKDTERMFDICQTNTYTCCLILWSHLLVLY